MRFSVPKKLVILYKLSVLLFLVHVIEEYLTLYHPTLFGVIFRTTDVPKTAFLLIEPVIIAGMLVVWYLLNKKLLPH